MLVNEEKLKELERLRGMTSRQIANDYNISMLDAGELKSSIKPEKYEILSNNNLDVKEMAKKLGINRKTATSYRSSLIKYGFAERKNIIKNKGIANKRREFLDNNPSTLPEIREYLGVKTAYIKDKKIGSKGPRRHKVYYLKEQEKDILPLIEAKLLVCPDEKRIEKIVLERLTKPMSIDTLQKETGLSHHFLKEATRKLIMEEKLNYVRRFWGGKKWDRKVILENEHFYKPGQEQEMADLIIPKIPIDKKTPRKEKVSWTSALRGNLPKPVFEIVHSCYTYIYDNKENLAMDKMIKTLDVAKNSKSISKLQMYDMVRNFSNAAKDFGLIIKDQKDFINYFKALSDFDLLENGAYSLREIGGYQEIEWNAPKLKNEKMSNVHLIAKNRERYLTEN